MNTKDKSPKLLILITQMLCLFATARSFAKPRIHNHIPAFLEYWDSTKHLPDEQRVRAFDLQVAPQFPAFYSYKYEKWARAGKNPDEEILRKLHEFEAIEESFRKRSASIESEILSAMATMNESFNDFDTHFDIHIAHSLGEMDGGGRTINGKLVFIFGVDGIVKYHHVANDVPYYQHELFHIYHSKYFKAPDQIWSALWAEGFATYVSEQLSPGASPAEIMLDVPAGLVEKCQGKIDRLVSAVYAVLDSDSEEIYAQWFLLSPTPDTLIPQRAGYYLGYLIAGDVHRQSGLSLQQLAQLNPKDILPLVKTALELRMREAPKASPFAFDVASK